MLEDQVVSSESRDRRCSGIDEQCGWMGVFERVMFVVELSGELRIDDPFVCRFLAAYSSNYFHMCPQDIA